MHRSIIASFVLLGSTLADKSTTTTTLFLLGFDQQPLVASIVDSDSTATTYSIACAPGTPSDECGAGPGFTLIEGPKTAHMEMIDGDASYFSFAADCDLAVTSKAICTQTAGGSGANFPGTSTTTYTGEEYKEALIVVTVLSATETGSDVSTATAPASTAASATAPTVSATATGATTAAASESTAAAASTVSTGGLPRVTGGVEWAVGGAAAAVAVALAGL